MKLRRGLIIGATAGVKAVLLVAVILLQTVMGSPAKNHESLSRTIESQFKKTMSPKLNFLGAFM